MSELHPLLSWLQKRRVHIARLTLWPLIIYLFAYERVSILSIDHTQYQLGLLALVVGVLTRSISAGTLHKNQQLNMEGIYAIVRNPLYVGSFFILLGINLIIHHPLVWAASIIIFSLTYIPTILGEENTLKKIFPDQWGQFEATVPRFIPNILRIFELRKTSWNFKQWHKNHEHYTVITAILVVVILELYSRYIAVN
ncbi:MAG TPA: isoprenylcysteine carboxylmethyltransferase family protein [Ectothiorhodospiraceae bacterium]|nr:isoprenylcysteine carboxylmethyltransferase family protein [Ectothiorhodospiraceae bacterium]